MMKDARKKLELTTEVGIFVGYTDTPQNYRVYLPDSGKNCCATGYKISGGESHEVFA